MRTSGYSNLRLSAPLLILIIIISLLPAMLFSNIANIDNPQATSTKYKANSASIWIKEKNTENYFLLNFQSSNQNQKLLKNIRIACIKCSNILPHSLIIANYATINNSKLYISDPLIYEQDLTPNQIPKLILNTSLSEEAILSHIDNYGKKKHSFFKLPNIIKTMEENGINALFYKIELHQHLASPLLFIGILLLALYLTNMSPRNNNYQKIILTGILLNFVLYFTLEIAQSLIFLKLGGVFSLIYLPRILLILIILYKLTRAR